MRVQTLGLIAITATLVGCGGGADDPVPPPVQNQSPKLSAIADQTISANQPGQTVGITISDEQPGSVTLLVSSDSQTLLPDDAQATGGSGTGRLAMLTPSPDERGQTTVTVTATDAQGLSDTTQFMLTVTPEQKSMSTFTRMTLDLPADDDPELINAVEFMQDADDDDFSDLFVE